VARLIERIQEEKQIVAKLDPLVNTVGGMAPATWDSAIKELDKPHNSIPTYPR
jgi:hypothetical protein